MKAIIFDFFNVLALIGSDSFRLTYFPDDFVKNQQVKQLQHDRELAIIDFDYFVTKVAAIGEIDRSLVLQHINNYQANIQLLNYIRQTLKLKYKIALIANTTQDQLEQILGLVNLAMFDDIISSEQVVLSNDETKAYCLIAKDLGVNKNECLYVGYLPSACRLAETIGMKSLWYWGLKQLEKEINERV